MICARGIRHADTNAPYAPHYTSTAPVTAFFKHSTHQGLWRPEIINTSVAPGRRGNVQKARRVGLAEWQVQSSSLYPNPSPLPPPLNPSPSNSTNTENGERQNKTPHSKFRLSFVTEIHTAPRNSQLNKKMKLQRVSNKNPPQPPAGPIAHPQA